MQTHQTREVLVHRLDAAKSGYGQAVEDFARNVPGVTPEKINDALQKLEAARARLREYDESAVKTAGVLADIEAAREKHGRKDARRTALRAIVDGRREAYRRAQRMNDLIRQLAREYQALDGLLDAVDVDEFAPPEARDQVNKWIRVMRECVDLRLGYDLEEAGLRRVLHSYTPNTTRALRGLPTVSDEIGAGGERLVRVLKQYFPDDMPAVLHAVEPHEPEAA